LAWIYSLGKICTCLSSFILSFPFHANIISRPSLATPQTLGVSPISCLSPFTLNSLCVKLTSNPQWRFYTLPLLLTLELYLVTSPTIPNLPLLPPGPLKLPHNHDPLLPFQLISLARTLSITLSIAISQLSPPQSPDNNFATGTSPQTLQYLDRLLTMSKLADAEATRLLSLSLSPFRGDGEGARDLRGRMREWVVLARVRGSKGVREVVEGNGSGSRNDKDRDVRRRAVAVEGSEGED